MSLMEHEAEQAAKKAQREYYAEWQRKNKEAQNAYHREWAKKNPEKVNAIRMRYWLKKAKMMQEEAMMNGSESKNTR